MFDDEKIKKLEALNIPLDLLMLNASIFMGTLEQFFRCVELFGLDDERTQSARQLFVHGIQNMIEMFPYISSEDALIQLRPLVQDTFDFATPEERVALVESAFLDYDRNSSQGSMLQ